MSINETAEKYLTEGLTSPSKRFKVGDKVRVIRSDNFFFRKEGVVTKIDGEYHYVDVEYKNKSYSSELYRSEIEKV